MVISTANNDTSTVTIVRANAGLILIRSKILGSVVVDVSKVGLGYSLTIMNKEKPAKLKRNIYKSVRMDEELASEIQEKAKKEDRSFGSMMRVLLIRQLDAQA